MALSGLDVAVNIQQNINKLDVKKSSLHSYYELKTNGISPKKALKAIINKRRLDTKSWAGLTDYPEHFKVSQIISFESKPVENLEHPHYQFRYLGRCDKPVSHSSLTSQAVEIEMVSKHDQVTVLMGRAENVLGNGYFNYLHESRYLDCVSPEGFYLQKILREHFSGALKVYLFTSEGKPLNEDLKRKIFFMENWKKWNVCHEQAVTPAEKTLFKFFLRQPVDFEKFIRQSMTSETIQMHCQAFRAWFWNQMLSEYVATNVPDNVERIGEYQTIRFRKKIEPHSVSERETMLDDLSWQMHFPSSQWRGIFDKIWEGLELDFFSEKRLRQISDYRLSDPKPLVVLPENGMVECKKQSDQSTIRVTCQLTASADVNMFIERLLND